MFGKYALKREEAKTPAPVAGATAATMERPRRTPAVSIRETDAAILIDADLPGVKAEQVQLSVNQGELILHGSVTVAGQGGFTLLHQEYEDGDFHRVFTLPDNIDTSGISAQTRHGVVTITLPKVKEAQPRRINVSAG
jgi:HSP20 family protein